jgi:hypothetical protein
MMLQKLLVPGWISPRGSSSKELTHLGRRLDFATQRHASIGLGARVALTGQILRSETFPCAAFQLVLQAGKLVLFVNGETTTQSLGAGGILGGGIV